MSNHNTQVRHQLLGALAYLKGEASAATPDLPEAYRHLSDQLPVTRVLGHGLLVNYLCDAGESYSYVQNFQLREAQLTADELHEEAINNLALHANQHGLRIFHHSQIHGVVLDQQFEASVLLLDDFWRGPASVYTPNGALAIVPARGMLLFCDRNSQAGLRELREHLAKGEAAGALELSAQVYQRDAQGRWSSLDGAAPT